MGKPIDGSYGRFFAGVCSNRRRVSLQLESAQGAPDAEAQQALRRLQEQMRGLEHAQKSASEGTTSQPDEAAPSDIEIASSIDRCLFA